MDKARFLNTALCMLALSCCIWSHETWSQEKKTEPKPASSASLEILPKVSEVHGSDQVKFTVVAKDALGKQMNLDSAQWFASPMGAVFAERTGVVTFHYPGHTTVGVVMNGQVAYVHINVLPMAAARVEIDPPGRPVVGKTSSSIRG